MDDDDASLNRTKDKNVHVRARATATEDLFANGAINEGTAATDSDLERQLSADTRKANSEW